MPNWIGFNKYYREEMTVMKFLMQVATVVMTVAMTMGVSMADEIDDFLAGPPKGGLPRCVELLGISDSEHDLCLAELDGFEGEINECQDLLDDVNATVAQLQDALSACEANDGGLPGDGVSGTALSFTNTGNTVLDNVTELEWARKNLISGDLNRRDIIVTYADAQAWIGDLNAADFEGGGWRLPNIKELMSVFDFGSGFPVIETSGICDFGISSSLLVWSTTPAANTGPGGGNQFVGDLLSGLVLSSPVGLPRRVVAVR